MQKLTGLDALFLHLDLPNAASHVSMIYIYDQSALAQPLRFRQIIAHLQARLDVSPIFRSKIVQTPLGLAYPYWAEDGEFNMDFHVRHSALPKPGDWRQFCIMAARLHSRPLDLARPPWEMYVIEGLDNVDWLPKGSFAIITKIHHAAIDGGAATVLTNALHDVAGEQGASVAEVVEQPPVKHRQSTSSLRDTLSRIVVDNVSAPFKLAGPLSRTLPKLAVAVSKIASRAVVGSETGVPQTRFNRQISAQRVFESAIFDFAVIKRIRAAVPGATVNDVALAIVGGAMRRYLEDKNELPKQSLVAMAPVNTREDPTEHQSSGNSISFLTFPVGSDIADPLERLRAINAATAETKARSSAIGGHDLTAITKSLPPASLAIAGRIATMAGLGGLGKVVLHNCAVTNIPGPQVQLDLLGAKLCYWSGVAPVTDGVGALFIVSTLGGRMIVSLTSTPEMLPDPAFYGDCIRAAVAELDEAAGMSSKGSAVPQTSLHKSARKTRPRSNKSVV